MPVFRVNKNKDYVVMSKYHLKEKNMSLKAKGLLSEMLSLPDNWDYSVLGLSNICIESPSTINSILKELEEFGYLERKQLRDTKGIFTGYEYNIYEKPYTKNPYTDYPYTENCIQLNNNKLNNKELNNNKEKNIKKRNFIKPSIEEIQQYCLERKNNIDYQRFYDYYETNGWVQGKTRKPIKDWKACIRTWERNNNSSKPNWFNQDIQKEEMSKEEIEKLRKELDL